ncbi:hypothetical protein [Limnoglobus roseus]|uniref:Uncharacterized protein n=1 Tax=Limnoglobus roseus TaxID=2598579 RepID=A0A5C1AMX6_9BACT|nr:hypothetical protein [Limnoglobus roseus]QEL19925.1 hypothetical protein PX52LOC_07007 [Limnoglobus roseus]
MFRSLLILLAAAPLTGSAPPKDVDMKPPLTLEASLSSLGGNRGGRAFLSVRLVATAGEAAVMTDRFTAVVERTEAKATVTIRPTQRKDSQGRAVIPSASTLGVVKLRPNEVAAVSVPTTDAPPGANPSVNNLDAAVSAAAAGKLELTVVYEVPDAWAKRFGLTATTVSGVATITEPKEKPADDRR